MSSDIDIVARTLYGEARGEGDIGMEAVAQVVMNRVGLSGQHPHFGDGTPASACLAPWQFSCWNTNDPNRAKLMAADTTDQAFARALDIAAAVVGGHLEDNTGGATYYKVTGTPATWADGHEPCCIIGHHEFYRNIA